MKKFLFTVVSALIVSFAAIAQVAPQRVDMRNVKVLPKSIGIESPTHFQTGLVTEKLTNECLFDANDGHANAFAFCIFDYRFKTNALVNFTTDAPADYEMQKNYEQVQSKSIGFFCSTFVGDKIFAYCYRYYGPGALVPLSLGFIDPKTGEYELAYDLPQGYDQVLSDMSYDPETNMIFANRINYDQDWNPTGTTIIAIDPNDPSYKFQELCTVPEELYTLACDRGQVYGIATIKSLSGKGNKNCYLVKMDAKQLLAQNPVVEEINKTKGLGLKIAYAQTMEFDKVNHRLWWMAQSEDDQSFFTEINTEKGTMENKTPYNMTAQFVSLAMPYQKVAGNAPSYVRDLKANVGAEGASSLELSWTNPSKDFNLDELKSLDKVQIWCDGYLIEEVTPTGIGQAQTYTHEGIKSGKHIYKVVPVNANGEGAYKELKQFVGHDVPAKVSNLKLVADGCKGTLTWDAPTVGVNGGWIDASTLKYDVFRFPDNKQVASDLTECQFIDEVTETQGYYYEVTAKNADGKGASATSNIVSYGPVATIPYFTPFNTETEFNKWTVIDANNDLFTWKFNKTNNVPASDRAVGPSDDYLISPELMFEEGKKYQVRLTYWTTNWVDANRNPINQKMEICYAPEATAEALKAGAIRDLGEFHTASETFLFAKQVFTVKGGKGFVAFHDYSDPDRGNIFLKDVCIREYSATDLSITDFKGSMTVVQGNKENFGVEVMNEGSARVENYTVDLIDATGKVLASAKGIAVDPEQKQIVTIEWTPETIGETHVTARVNLEGDTYAADNTWADLMDVTVSPSGSAQWLTLNTDDHYVDEIGNMYNFGNDYPFNFGKAYSFAECIYLDKEITKKNISITGIQFMFDGMSEGDYKFNVRVSAIGTEKNYFGWNEEDLMVESIDPEDPDWMKLYEGEVAFGGTEKGQRMVLNFETPYYYEGGNLCFKYEKLWSDDYFDGSNGSPAFYYHDMYNDGENERQRTCKTNSNNSEYVDPDRIGTMYFIPFTMIAYEDGNINGIMGVSQEGLNFDLFGGKLTMSQVCDNITVYNMAGQVVAEGHNVKSVNVAGNGIYVIKATAGNKSISTKVSVN